MIAVLLVTGVVTLLAIAGIRQQALDLDRMDESVHLALGLDHSASADSLMRAAISLFRQEVGCALAPDDVAAINRLYNAQAAPVFTAAPDGLVATARSATVVDLAWVDHADSEDGYRVEARATGEPFREVAVLPPNAFSTVVSPNLPCMTFFGLRSRCSTPRLCA